MADPLKTRLAHALTGLEGKSTRHDRDNLARFNIDAPKAFGVSMANMRVLAKGFGRDHELAQALWKSSGNSALGRRPR